MNQDLLKYAEEQGFESLEDEIKKNYVSQLLDDLQKQSALNDDYTTNPEAKLTLTGVKFNNLEYTKLCSDFLAEDKYHIVETLVEHTGMAVPTSSIEKLKLKYTSKLVESSKEHERNNALNNLEKLTKLANKKPKINPCPLVYDPKQIQEVHAQYLSKFRFAEAAKLMKVTGIKPKAEDIYNALEKKLLR